MLREENTCSHSHGACYTVYYTLIPFSTAKLVMSVLIVFFFGWYEYVVRLIERKLKIKLVANRSFIEIHTTVITAICWRLSRL